MEHGARTGFCFELSSASAETVCTLCFFRRTAHVVSVINGTSLHTASYLILPLPPHIYSNY
jgi:hypothetical protein